VLFEEDEFKEGYTLFMHAVNRSKAFVRADSCLPSPLGCKSDSEVGGFGFEPKGAPLFDFIESRSRVCSESKG